MYVHTYVWEVYVAGEVSRLGSPSSIKKSVMKLALLDKCSEKERGRESVIKSWY